MLYAPEDLLFLFPACGCVPGGVALPAMGMFVFALKRAAPPVVWLFDRIFLNQSFAQYFGMTTVDTEG